MSIPARPDLAPARSAIAAAGHRIDRLGLATGSSGNISVRTECGYLITPTGGSLGALDADGVAELDTDGERRSGPKPSKEVPLHMAFYARDPAIRAVVHLHSPYATALACREPWSASSALPPITPYFLMRVGRTPLVPFAPPGSADLAHSLDTVTTDVRSVLLANHGSLLAGDDLAGAVDAAIELESAARAHLQSAGPTQNPLTPAQIAQLREHHPIRWPVG